MPVTKVTTGKSRRDVKATNTAAKSKDSTNLTDSTSIDVDKSDSHTDDEALEVKFKAFLKREKLKKDRSIDKSRELITRLEKRVAEQNQSVDSKSSPISKKKRVDSPPKHLENPPVYSDILLDSDAVDYSESDDGNKDHLTVADTKSEKEVSVSEKTIDVVTHVHSGDDEDIVTNYIDESTAPSKLKDLGIVLRDFDVERLKFMPRRKEINSRKGYTDRQSKTPLYSTHLITRDRYEELKDKVDMSANNWPEQIDDYLISSFHYSRHMVALRARGGRPKAPVNTNTALAASWYAFVMRVNGIGIKGIIARVKSLEFTIPLAQREKLIQEQKNASSSSTKRIQKDVPSRKSRRDRERPRSIDRVESKCPDRMDIRSTERGSVAHGDRDASSYARYNLLGNDQRSFPRDKESHPSSQLSGVDERAEIASALHRIQADCSENRDVCSDRRGAIYARLRNLESFPEEISLMVKDVNAALVQHATTLKAVQQELSDQTELYDDLKKKYDLLNHRHEVKTVKTLKELKGHVRILNASLNFPLPRSPVLTPAQQDFLEKSKDFLDKSLASSRPPIALEESAETPVVLEENAEIPADPPLEKSDTS